MPLRDHKLIICGLLSIFSTVAERESSERHVHVNMLVVFFSYSPSAADLFSLCFIFVILWTKQFTD